MTPRNINRKSNDKNNKTANDNGDDNFSPPEITNSQSEEQLLRDDITNELDSPLYSTIVVKRQKEMLHVPLDFENCLKKVLLLTHEPMLVQSPRLS